MDARIPVQWIAPLSILGVASVSAVTARVYAEMRRGARGIPVARCASERWRNDPILRMPRFLIIRDPVLCLGCIEQYHWKV